MTGFSQSSEQIDKLFEKLEWRNIGPANMGGRTVDIDVVESKPWIIYAAMGPSGVWKSENNGITWNPVFDKENTVSVGDVTICQSNPDIVWVGSGEATTRNSVTIGDGIYKSNDGGKTWKNMGLKNTRHISRIVINSDNPNILYVAAQGHLWGANEERGVYKTSDGGKTWQKVLYINKNTGIADLAIDPLDGKILYAAAWDYQRFPYYFYSGGPGSGIYKSLDGGENWKRLVKGLPEGVLGRIGLAVSRSNPDVVYALIEHKDGGIWRSEDKGENWKRMCDNKTFITINFRPFYYSQIRVDPSDDKVVYVFSGGTYVSKNMGEKFKAISAGTHSDHHALWIDPDNPKHLIDGNDGGIDITYDGGKNWHPIKHMAVAEVYQIGFDFQKPYHVFCGLQDNGAWGGPSATYDSAGIVNDDWYVLAIMGDGFFVKPDPSDHNIIYGNYQMNGLTRVDQRIGRGRGIRPEASLNEPVYRFNWNSPIHISPHDPKTVYTGGNYLFRTRNGGHNWEIISPDLSTNDPEKQKDSGGVITMDNTGAEIHCTILTIAESPVQKGVIWCGTDDGNVQITRDDGKSWGNVVENIPGLPKNTWCSRIEASHFEAGTAYAAFDGHRMDDYSTYLYKTNDFGKSWTSIKNGLPFGWVHVIREDIRNKNLLFVGTEFGIFASLDRGKTWFSLKNDMPTTAVRDIAVHPRENDLIIGTHGRGIWIMDDISPLQEFSDDVFNSKMYLFSIRPDTQFYASVSREAFARPVFSAKNPPYGLTITTYFKDKPEERPEIFITNPAGEKIYEMKIRKKAGLQRNTWNLQYVQKTKDGKLVKPTGFGMASLPLASPGEYKIELSVGENTLEKKGIVHPDPRFEFNEKDRAAQRDSQVEIIVLSKKMGLAVTRTRVLRRRLDKLNEEFGKKDGITEEVYDALKKFEKKFRILEEKVTPKGIGYRGSMEMALRGGPVGGSYSMMVMFLGMDVSGYPSPITETQSDFLKELTVAVSELVDTFNKFITIDISDLNELLTQHDLSTLRAPDEIVL
jgi:photosystem II stability/assembly factor-like uncharacterized protein